MVDDGMIKEHWDPILRALGHLHAFEERYDEANSHNVTHYFTFDRENLDSVVSCLFAARENAHDPRSDLCGAMGSGEPDVSVPKI